MLYLKILNLIIIDNFMLKVTAWNSSIETSKTAAIIAVKHALHVIFPYLSNALGDISYALYPHVWALNVSSNKKSFEP